MKHFLAFDNGSFYDCELHRGTESIHFHIGKNDEQFGAEIEFHSSAHPMLTQRLHELQTAGREND